MKYSYQYLLDEWTNGYWNFMKNTFKRETEKDEDPFPGRIESCRHLLSLNENITWWDIIQKNQNNQDQYWDWAYIVQNKNIT